MKTALLIIDVQNIMFSYQDGVYQGQKVLDTIEALINKARASNTQIIYIQHTEDEEGPFQTGNPSREIHKQIQALENDIVIAKYSWDSFLNTELHATLQSLKIERLVIAGMQTDFCVDTTVRSAYSKGYKKNLFVCDGHSTFDTEDLKAEDIIKHHNRIISGRFAQGLLAKDVTF